MFAYGVAGAFVVKYGASTRGCAPLYPFESMETRVPEPKPAPREQPPARDAVARLTRLEGRLEGRVNGYRNLNLEVLHEYTVSQFINNPGFGVARMIIPNEWNLTANLDRRPTPPQPAPRGASGGSPGEWRC